MQQPSNTVPRKILVLDVAMFDKLAPENETLIMTEDYNAGLYAALKTFSEKMGFEIVVNHKANFLSVQEVDNLKRLNKNISFCNTFSLMQDLNNIEDKSNIYFFGENKDVIEARKEAGFTNSYLVTSDIQRNEEQQYQLGSSLVEQLLAVVQNKFNTFSVPSQQQDAVRPLPQPQVRLQSSNNTNAPVTKVPRALPQPLIIKEEKVQTPISTSKRVEGYISPTVSQHQPSKLLGKHGVATGQLCLNQFSKNNASYKEYAAMTLYTSIAGDEDQKEGKRVLPQIDLDAQGILSITVPIKCSEILQNIIKDKTANTVHSQNFDKMLKLATLDNKGNLTFKFNHPNESALFFSVCGIPSSKVNMGDLYQELCKDNLLNYKEICKKHEQTQSQGKEPEAQNPENSEDSEEGFFSGMIKKFTAL